jgi:hypothetical protein
MNQEQAAQWAKLFQAIADGKTVQRIRTYMTLENRIAAEWDDVDTIDSNLNQLQYRIKPEPGEWHLLVDSCGGVVAGSIGASGVIACQKDDIKPGVRTVKVREVIE